MTFKGDFLSRFVNWLSASGEDKAPVSVCPTASRCLFTLHESRQRLITFLIHQTPIMSATASQMDYVLPNELVDGMILAGGKKATVSIKNLLIRGFYSGAILGLAVILALTVGILTKLPFVGSLSVPLWFCQHRPLRDGVSNG